MSILLIALCVYPYYQKEKAFLMEKKPLKRGWIFLPVLAAVLAVGFNFLWGLIPFFVENQSYQAVVEKQYSYPLGLGLILYGFAVPLAEEILFRGTLYNIVKRHTGKTFGIVISSFLFGVFHGNIVQASYGMTMGMIMAYLYEKYHDLKVPFLFHSGANLAVYLFPWPVT